MNKKIRLTISLIGLLAALVYMLYFFRVIDHPSVPWIAGGTVVAVYLFGVYAQKRDKEN